MKLLSRWGAFLTAVALAVLALVAAGCGTSASTTEESATPSNEADLAVIEADPALAAILPAGMISTRVASEYPYPPWECSDLPTSKNVTGFDYDLSQASPRRSASRHS